MLIIYKNKGQSWYAYLRGKKASTGKGGGCSLINFFPSLGPCKGHKVIHFEQINL